MDDINTNILTGLCISHKLPDMLRKMGALTYIWRLFSSSVGGKIRMQSVEPMAKVGQVSIAHVWSLSCESGLICD